MQVDEQVDELSGVGGLQRGVPSCHYLHLSPHSLTHSLFKTTTQLTTTTMDHDHGDGDMDMENPMCSMNMLFTWSTTDLCIVFSSWHIRSTLSLILSLVAIVLLGIGYEALRAASRRYESLLATRTSAAPRKSSTLRCAAAPGLRM